MRRLSEAVLRDYPDDVLLARQALQHAHADLLAQEGAPAAERLDAAEEEELIAALYAERVRARLLAWANEEDR